jgi:hypothetical protein
VQQCTRALLAIAIPIARQVSVKNVTKYYASDFYPPKKPRQVFLPPGYGFSIWFECLISQFNGLTWQAGPISFVQWTDLANRSDKFYSAGSLDKAGEVSFVQWIDLTKQLKSVLFIGLISGGLT